MVIGLIASLENWHLFIISYTNQTESYHFHNLLLEIVLFFFFQCLFDLQIQLLLR